jgi:hypothetical protein
MQPKPLTASGYCYFGRLHFLIQDLDLQPVAFRFCLLQHNLPAVLSRTEVWFRDEASFRPWCRHPKDPDQFQKAGCRSAFFSEALWLNRWKNVSGFIDLLSILDRSPFAQASALMMRSPEGLNEADRVSVKKPFPVPHRLSSLLSLTW